MPKHSCRAHSNFFLRAPEVRPQQLRNIVITNFDFYSHIISTTDCFPKQQRHGQSVWGMQGKL